MKKVLFIAVVVLLGLGNLSAQKTTYGVTAGFHSLDISVSVDGLTVSTSGSGYFVGFFADFNVSDNFNVQSEIHFASAYQDGDAANEIIIPVMVKYYVSEKFNIQSGPQFDFIVDESENVNKFGVGLGFGAGYDISEKIFAATRYTLGLSNRIQDGPSGMSAKFNTFQIGLGYRF